MGRLPLRTNRAVFESPRRRDGRFNVFAAMDPPVVVSSAHNDCLRWGVSCYLLSWSGKATRDSM